jgi:hypothetical protein
MQKIEADFDLQLNLVRPQRPRQKQLDVVESAKTLRKLGLSGDVGVVHKYDFEWPVKADVEAFKTDSTIKLVNFKWKENKCLYENFRCLTALQLIFNNGLRSPLFLVDGETGDNLKSTDLD